jgi:invasion protein IalB
MTVAARSLLLPLVLSLSLGQMALAQDTTTENPNVTAAPAADQPVTGTELNMGQNVANVAEPYVKSTHGDWQLRCIRTQDGSDPCEIYQLLKDAKGNSVAEITMVALPDGGQAVAGATVIVPLETLLPQELRLAIDGGTPKSYPYSFCATVGCFSRIGFTGEEIEKMKKGNKATISVVPIAAPDKIVSVDISLKGFTDALTAVKAEMPKP